MRFNGSVCLFMAVAVIVSIAKQFMMVVEMTHGLLRYARDDGSG